MKKTNLLIAIVVILLVSGCFKINKEKNKEMNEMSYFTKDTKVVDHK